MKLKEINFNELKERYTNVQSEIVTNGIQVLLMKC